MKRSSVCPSLWVGTFTCCCSPNSSNRSLNFAASLSEQSSTWKLKSPVIKRGSFEYIVSVLADTHQIPHWIWLVRLDVPLSMLADKQQLILWQEMDILWAIQRTQIICSLLIAAHCSAFFFLIQGHLIWQTWKSDDMYWQKLQQYLYHWHIHQRNSQFFYWLYWSFSTQSTMVWHRTLNQLLLEPLNQYYRSSAINQYYFFGPQWVKHVPIVENCGGMEKNVRFLTVQLHTHVLINVGAYGQTFSIS